MLTLTRRVGETIEIGDDIVIVVKEIRRNQVRIGIVAPSSLEIHRGEIAERRAKEQAERDGRAQANAGRSYRNLPEPAVDAECEVRCPRCRGTGAASYGTPCDLCLGTGLVDEDIARSEVALQQLRSR